MHGDVRLAKQWAEKAQNDLLNADNNLKAVRIPLDTVCFHCQQAAEKLLKAFLILRGREATRTHDLLLLLQGCIEIEPGMESLRNHLIILNPYAVEIRYPDDALSLTIDDATEARNSAEQILVSLKQRVSPLFS